MRNPREPRAILVALLVTLTMLLPSGADAQGVCYSHDLLGRLTRVTDPAGATGFYEYDAVGNIVAIRRQTLSGPVAIASMTPSSGPVGTLVEVSGIGFSAVAAENQVTVNGVSAAVVAATPCGVTIRIPDGASSGPIAVTTPRGSATSGESFVLAALAISLPGDAVLVGQTLQFGGTVTGCSDPRMVWSVDGIVGGNATVGTITADGRYTAPTSVAGAKTVTIQAESAGCPMLFAERKVLVLGEPNGLARAAVSVSFGPRNFGAEPGSVAHGVSVLRGQRPTTREAGVLAGGVSVLYGVPPPAPVQVLAVEAASVTRGPVVLEVNPAAAAAGSSVTMVISGANLTGATDVVFVRPGGLDADIVATSLSVDASGTRLTATVIVSAAAATGRRVVMIRTTTGDSTSFSTGRNEFNVSGP